MQRRWWTGSSSRLDSSWLVGYVLSKIRTVNAEASDGDTSTLVLNEFKDSNEAAPQQRMPLPFYQVDGKNLPTSRGSCADFLACMFAALTCLALARLSARPRSSAIALLDSVKLVAESD